MTYQNSTIESRFPGKYNHHLLVKGLTESRLTPEQAAKKAGLSDRSVMFALAGGCKKMETLWALAKVLGVKWEYLFKLDLSETQFRRAVDRSANSETVR